MKISTPNKQTKVKALSPGDGFVYDGKHLILVNATCMSINISGTISPDRFIYVDLYDGSSDYISGETLVYKIKEITIEI